jgi:hypothetical protein
MEHLVDDMDPDKRVRIVAEGFQDAAASSPQHTTPEDLGQQGDASMFEDGYSRHITLFGVNDFDLGYYDPELDETKLEHLDNTVQAYYEDEDFGGVSPDAMSITYGNDPDILPEPPHKQGHRRVWRSLMERLAKARQSYIPDIYALLSQWFGLQINENYAPSPSNNPYIRNWTQAGYLWGDHKVEEQSYSEFWSRIIDLSNAFCESRAPELIPALLWDRQRPTPSLAFSIRILTTQIEDPSLPGKRAFIQKHRYLIQENVPTSGYALLLDDPVTAVQCLRLGNFRSCRSLAVMMNVRGIAFSTRVAVKSSELKPSSKNVYLTHWFTRHALGWRYGNDPGGVDDFLTYLATVMSWCQSPRARAASELGGLYWRIVRMFVDMAAVCDGPSEYVTAAHIGHQIQDGDTVWLDDEITPAEKDMLLGVYSVLGAF